MDLVDEEDVPLVQRGQDRGQIPCPLDGRTAGVADVGAELPGHDRGQGRLAKARRAVKEDVIGGVPSLAGGAQEDRQVRLELALADVLVQGVRPQAAVYRDLKLVFDVRGESTACRSPTL